MTLHEVAVQIHGLTKGRINGEKFSKAEFEQVLARWFRYAEHNVIPNTVVMELELPDGNWLSTVTKGWYGYDYFVPDTREQEARIVEAITK